MRRSRAARDGGEVRQTVTTVAAHLPGPSRHDAGRSARARGDAAVLHASIRQRRQPPPRVRLGGRGGGRARPQAGRATDRRQRRRRSSSPAAPPRPTTSRSRAPRRCAASRATTSSPWPPSTRRCSTPASSLETAGLRGHAWCRCEQDGRIDLDELRGGDHRQHHADLDDDRQQRDRRAAADRRDRRGLPRRRACCSTPTRCRRPARCRSTSTALNVDLVSLTRAQDVRPQGRRRALCAPQPEGPAGRQSPAAATSAACAPAR